MSELDRALQEIGQIQSLAHAVESRFSEDLAAPTAQASDQELARLSVISFVHYQRAVEHALAHDESAKADFGLAFTAFRGILAAKRPDVLNPLLLAQGLLRDEHALLLHLSVAGLGSERTAEVRHDLLDYDVPEIADFEAWDVAVATAITGAVTRLIRKARGWADVDEASELIERLRKAQEEYEGGFLEAKSSAISTALSAYDLLGLYNLAQICTVSADYVYGRPHAGRSMSLSHVKRHYENAMRAFGQRGDAGLQIFAATVRTAGEKLIENSIWSHVDSLGERAREYARVLVGRSRPQPILELWPGQQDALKSNLMDPYRKAIVVQMPTSGGKTLLAKFVILQAKSLNPNGSVAYVVPSRALVNQVTAELRSDFAHLEQPLSVEQAVPVFELDPTEDRLLQTAPDILVTTPEKLGLLVRRSHVSVQNISLVIVDEAHNISDQTRGATLELLLGTIKRERPTARFLLLSPFLRNPHDIAGWLSDRGSGLTVSVDWRPTPRIVGMLDFKRRGSVGRLLLRSLSAADSIGLPTGREIALGEVTDDTKSIKNFTNQATRSLRQHGSVLVLCGGPGTAISRARELAEGRVDRDLDQKTSALLNFLSLELGQASPLLSCVRRGVAYHHAGLSGEVRQIVEQFLRDGIVDTVCGTTTLAEGVNFPIKTVIFESTKQKRRQQASTPLSYDKFWNIAGRAGRALKDSFGVVAFPRLKPSSEAEVQEYLRGEAALIASQLANIISAVDTFGLDLGNKAIEQYPQVAALLQYLSHAIRVAGELGISDEIDDILRGSLAYYQAETLGPSLTQRLAEVCRHYISRVSSSRWLLDLSDATGFATPTVLQLIRHRDQDRTEFRNESRWAIDRLFGADISPLTKRVSAVSDLPGLRLGTDDSGSFNPQRVAEITRDWVNGMNVESLTEKYARKTEDQTGIPTYVYGKLSSGLSWGMAAFESVCFAGNDLQQSEAAYIPSFIYYGVRTKEAVWMRMAGVPRAFAERFASVWQQAAKEPPASFNELRIWVRENVSRINLADLRISSQDVAAVVGTLVTAE